MSNIVLRSITGVPVRGRRVLLRTSLNVALDGNIADDRRLMAALPTLRYLAEGGAKIIIAGYFGRSGETLRPVAEALMALAPDISMRFTDAPLSDVAAETAGLSDGSALILENTRRDPGEEANDPVYAHELAGLADIFVSDAFAEAHRNYASNVGVAALLPSYAGFLMQEEVERLSHALTPAHPAIAILAGAKFETKRPLLLKLLPLYDRVLIGGAIANDFLNARGVSVGASAVSDTPLSRSVAEDPRIELPADFSVCAPGEDPHHATRLEAEEKIADIGPHTARAWARRVSEASFVLWNGPTGIYEEGFTAGVETLARAISESACKAVIGGGDTDAALSKFSFEKDRVFISTGGGAMLAFLAGETLPGIEVLRKRS